LVMAHSQAAYQRLGRLLSDLSQGDLETTARHYIEALMPALQRRVTRQRHVNVLQHVMGYLKKRIDSGDKAELSDSIEAYRRGEVPLVVPITLLRHYFRRHPDAYMAQQVYLNPHPDKLGLRNAI
ncbi:MAG: YbgA family protein, partial [Candidatus Thiodiazotropha sp.]